MKLVVDANVVIAALLKEGSVRRILFNLDFEFISPDFILTEIYKYKDYIIGKAGYSEQDFEILISLIFDIIKIFPREQHERFIEEAEKMIKDKKDVPYVALYLASNADGIWSEDPDFLEQNKIKVYTTKDIIDLF